MLVCLSQEVTKIIRRGHINKSADERWKGGGSVVEGESDSVDVLHRGCTVHSTRRSLIVCLYITHNIFHFQGFCQLDFFIL